MKFYLFLFPLFFYIYILFFCIGWRVFLNLQQFCKDSNKVVGVWTRYSCNFQWTKTWVLHFSNCCAWLGICFLKMYKCSACDTSRNGNLFGSFLSFPHLCFKMFVLGLYLVNWMAGQEKEGYNLHCSCRWSMWGAKD